MFFYSEAFWIASVPNTYIFPGLSVNNMQNQN